MSRATPMERNARVDRLLEGPRTPRQQRRDWHKVRRFNRLVVTGRLVFDGEWCVWQWREDAEAKAARKLGEAA